MEDLVAELRQLDVSGTQRMDAGVFQAALERHGMPLGTTAGDAAVARCRVEPDGRVSFAPLAAPASVEKEKVARPSVRPPIAGIGFESASASASASASPAPVLSSLDAKELVRSSTQALHDVFTAYDNGKLSIRDVQREVAGLGLELTPAFQSLVRSAPLDMTFSQLFQALLRVSGSPLGAAGPGGNGGKNGSGGALQAPTRAKAPVSVDPITWNRDCDAGPTGVGARRSGKDLGLALDVSQNQSQALNQSQDQGQGQSGTTAIPLRAPLSPKGLESVDSPWHTVGDTSNPLYSVRPTTPSHPSRKKADLGRRPNESHFSLGEPADAAHAHAHAHANANAHAAASEEAKHDEEAAAAAALKEAAYQCVRELDQGALSAADCERRLRRCLGVELSAEVKRLLASAQSNGVVHFSQFVVALDHLISPREDPALAAAAAALAAGSRVLAHAPPCAHIFEPAVPPPPPAAEPAFSSVTSRAQTTHGDLIAWSQGPGQLESAESCDNERSGKKHSAAPDGMSRAHLADHVDLTWKPGAPGAPGAPPGGGAPAVRKVLAQRSDNIIDAHHRPTSGMLAWHDAEHGAMEPAGGKPAQTGTSRKASESAQDRCPFGIEYDGPAKNKFG